MQMEYAFLPFGRFMYALRELNASASVLVAWCFLRQSPTN